MTFGTVDSSGETSAWVDAKIAALRAGNTQARDELVAFAAGRMQAATQRMLRRFPKVRRWEETNDVAQNAVIRLYKTLQKIVPHDARGFLALAAVHIRRELLDLARKYAGPQSHSANHQTSAFDQNGRRISAVDVAASLEDSPDETARWIMLHEAAEKLPDEERELFGLIWYLGMPQAQAAETLGCSLRTVKRRWESVKSHMRHHAPD